MLSGKTSSPVLTDASPIKEARVGLHSKLMPCSQPGASFSAGLYIQNPKKKSSKLEDVLSNGWLDAMRSSSPPRKKILKDFKVDQVVPDDSDFGYSSWMMRDAVRNVAKHFPTAIISGRSRDKVYELVGLTELYYAGSHGMDIMGPKHKECDEAHSNSVNSTDLQGKDVSLFQPAKEFLPMINEVFNALVEITKDIKGAKVENHKFCTSVHYRNVNEKSWPTIAQRVHDVLKNYPRLRLTHGRKVLEVRPVIDWDKGKAVEFLLESLDLNYDDDVLPIFIGDDRTDEDAFKVLRKRKQGYGILVSQIPKETNAFYSLKDPLEVKQFLKALVKWKEQDDILQGDSSTTNYYL